MADNILKAIISVQAPGVAQTTSQVASNVNKVEQSFKRLGPTTNSANLSLLNTGRVIQDLPFGFLGIANNLNPLLESFQRLKAETGSTSTALSALGKSLVGAGGLGFAISIISSALIVFGDRLFGSKKRAEESKEALDALATSIDTVKRSTEGLTSALQFQNQLGAVNVKIFGLGDLEDLRQQSVAQQQLVVDLTNNSLKAQQNYQQALKLLNEKTNDDTREAEKKALEGLRDAQKKEEDAREKGRIIFRQIELQKINDRKEAQEKALKDYKEYLAKLKELDAKQRAGVKELVNGVEAEFELADRGVLKEGKAGGFGGDIGKLGTSMQESFQKTAQTISGLITPAITEMISAIGRGENAFKSFGNAVVSIIQGVVTKLIEAVILAGILSAISGGATSFGSAFGKILGIGGFGGASGRPGIAGIGSLGLGGGGQIQLVLRGQDLYGSLAATGRSNNRLGG